MLISGFSFARNAHKLGYPVAESIKSILPICDEFIIAIGQGDDGDRTRESVLNINDPKIRIIDTEWRDIERIRSAIYSRQTNIALSECRGEWCFYIQADEILHEKYLGTVRRACDHFASDRSVDGLLFRYRHFWGDYDHYLVNHRWYPREIRIIRNNRKIVSVGDAQSFRYADRRKVPVVALDAEIFHYGHVRDPRTLHVRKKVVNSIYKGTAESERNTPQKTDAPFDYGSLEKLPVYSGTYPQVMKERIASINWKHLLTYSGKSAAKLPHDRLKYRILTFIEQKIFMGSGREFWGYKPYRVLRFRTRKYSETTKSAPETPQ